MNQRMHGREQAGGGWRAGRGGWGWRLVVVRVFLGLGPLGVHGAGHQHINAGAFDSRPTAPLYFVNGDRFSAESGYVLPFTPVSTGPQAGLYRGGITFTALPSTSDYGGPAFHHAAPGAHLRLVVEQVEGPVGGRFGFWEGLDGEEGSEQTFGVSVGTAGGVQSFALSETAGVAGDDPYGHVHGRVFTVDRPGLYTLGLRIVDVSGNGEGGGPLHPPSVLYRMHLQAGVSVGRVERTESGLRIEFGALAGSAYQMEASDRVGEGAVWEEVGDRVEGDDRLHAVEVRLDGVGASNRGARFFRLKRVAP